jgi:hypothetical protein
MEYQQPQKHHWIALRLMKGYVVLAKTHNRDCFLTVQWLIRELGLKAVNQMLDQLKLEEEEA